VCNCRPVHISGHYNQAIRTSSVVDDQFTLTTYISQPSYYNVLCTCVPARTSIQRSIRQRCELQF